MSNPYRKECDTLKAEIMHGFKTTQSLCPNYTKAQFLKTIKKELQILNVRANSVIRSGQHVEDDLRISILAETELVQELENELLEIGV